MFKRQIDSTPTLCIQIEEWVIPKGFNLVSNNFIRMKNAIQIILILDFWVMLAHTALLSTSQHHTNNFSLIPPPQKAVKKTNSLSGCYPFLCSLHITIPPFRGVSRAVSVVAPGLQGSHKTKKSWGVRRLGAKQPMCVQKLKHIWSSAWGKTK